MENWKTKNKIVIILEKILKVDNQNQRGQVLKILTSSQMLSRLSITLAQSKTRNNSEKTWNEEGNYSILSTDGKNLEKLINSI